MGLRFALERAREGRGGTHFLSGSDGMGKSRLAQSMEEEAERQGFLVARGCAYPMESGVPYGIFCDRLDPLVRAATPEALVSLTRGAPEFQFICPSLAAGQSAVPDALGGDGIPDLRNRLLWNVPPFLDRLRRNRPLLLVFEDLEWADTSSLELLHFLGRQLAHRPLVLLGTFSTEPQGNEEGLREAIQSLVNRAGATVLELGPLEAEEVEELVSRGFGVDPTVIHGFAWSLYRWTGGNPHFVESTLRALVNRGRLRREEGRWVGWTMEGLAPPGSIRDLVRERLRRLGEAARELADWAAVLGTRPTFDLVRRGSGLSDTALMDGLSELARHRILLEEKDGAEGALGFPHPVVQEVIYGEIGPARARMLHARASRALEERHGPDHGGNPPLHADRLAHHLIRAGGDGTGDGTAFEAVPYLAAAGRSALSVHANREAAEYLREAWSRRGTHPDVASGDEAARRLLDLVLDLARAEQRLGATGRPSPSSPRRGLRPTGWKTPSGRPGSNGAWDWGPSGPDAWSKPSGTGMRVWIWPDAGGMLSSRYACNWTAVPVSGRWGAGRKPGRRGSRPSGWVRD